MFHIYNKSAIKGWCNALYPSNILRVYLRSRHTVIPAMRQVDARFWVQGPPGLQYVFKASLGNLVRLCLKIREKHNESERQQDGEVCERCYREEKKGEM